MDDRTIKHIVENPSHYSDEEVKFAGYMKDKFDNAGTVKYDKEGMETVGQWVKEYIDANVPYPEFEVEVKEMK